jgi:hypothetical protein
MPTISRLFDDYASAKQALRALVANGIPEADISIVANNSDNFYNERANLVDRDNDDVEGAAETAGGVGAVAGGAVGLLTGLGIMAIPGVGPVVAAGWLATTALRALAGGAAGSIIGALVESGVPEQDAHVYAEGLRRGGVLLTVRTDSATPTNIERIIDKYAVDTRARGDDYRRTGWKNFDETSSPYTADQIRAERDLRL